MIDQYYTVLCHLGTNWKVKSIGPHYIAQKVEKKLIELQRRAKRANAKIIDTKKISVQQISSLYESADYLLLDVPCSGLGVIKRNPDAKWKLSSEFIITIQKTQRKILKEYSPMLKPGGTMVYATCSILPSENQKQVVDFLSNNNQFELLEEKTIMPSWGFDGFYMAKMIKKK